MRLFLILMFFGTQLYGQYGDTQAAHSLNSPFESRGTYLEVDGEGNVYHIGTYKVSVDVDPGPDGFILQGSANNNTYLRKLSSSGELLWARRLGGSGTTIGFSMTIADDGYIYISGTFEETMTCFGGDDEPSQTAELYLDIFVVKYDSNGNVIWLKKFGGNGIDNAVAITVDNLGGVYMTGRFTHTCNFNPEGTPQYRTAVGYHDAFILKINTEGMYQWVRTMGGITYESGADIHVDPNGVYVTGTFNYEINLSGVQTIPTNGGRDVFITKHSHDGEFLWGKILGDSYSDDGRTISTNSEGHVFIGGNMSGDVDMDPGEGTVIYDGSNNDVAFILKLDADGNYMEYIAFDYINQSGFPEAQGCSVTKMRHDQYDNLYAIGGFRGTFDFDPDSTATNFLTSEGGGDGYVLKLDADNKLLWISQYAGLDESSRCFPSAIALGLDNAIYHTGYFRTAIDFNPTGDSFILEAPPNTSWAYLTLSGNCEEISEFVSIEACSSFTSDSGIQYTESGTFTETFSVNGCDSVVMYEVTLLANDIHENQSACDSYYWEETDNVYNTSGEYAQHYVNVHGCDSVITLHLTISESNDVFVDTIHCMNFVLPGTQEVIDQSGTYTDIFINESGCDSLIHYDIEILEVVYEVVNEDPQLSVIGIDSEFQWYRCYPLEAITNATESDFFPNSNGSYAVEVYQNGCTTKSECMTVLKAEISLQDALFIYPNPTYQDELRIDLGKYYDRVEIKIYDIQGRLVASQRDYATRESQLLLPNLAKGLYTLRIHTNNDDAAVAKFVLG